PRKTIACHGCTLTSARNRQASQHSMAFSWVGDRVQFMWIALEVMSEAGLLPRICRDSGLRIWPDRWVADLTGGAADFRFVVRVFAGRVRATRDRQPCTLR